MHLSDFEDKEIESYEYVDRYILGAYKEMEVNFIKYLELNQLDQPYYFLCFY